MRLRLIASSLALAAAKVPTTLKPGQSYEVCQAFLIAKGGSIDGAVWVQFDPKHPTKSDINWK